MSLQAVANAADKTIRTLGTVRFYEGPNVDEMLRTLMTNRFTGPIRLNVSTGRVISIEWREKVVPTLALDNT
jgi:hypothetical protein